jgi:HK97 family phage major capsid protein
MNIVGYAVGTEYETNIVKSITQYNVMRDICTVISTASDRKIPIEDSITTAALVAEEGAIGATSQPVLSQVTLGSYKLGNIVKVSSELLNDSFFDVAGYVAEQLGRSFGIAEEDYCVTGTGSSQPQGILVGAAAGVTAASPTAVTMNEMMELMYSVARAERANGSFLMGDDLALILRKLVDGESRYLWEVSTKAGEPDTLLGKPVYVSESCNAVEASAVVAAFGNMKKYYIADRVGRTLQRLNELYAGNGQVGFLLTERFDGKLVQSAAVKKLTMAAS